MSVWLRLSGEGPLYLQIYGAVRTRILSGDIAVGEALPPTRKLAKMLGVSRNVVLIAYDQLKAEGYAEGQTGGGTRAIVPAGDAAHFRQLEDEPRDETDWRQAVSSQSKRALEHWEERQRLHESYRDDLIYDFRYGDVEVDTTTLKVWKRLSGQYLNHPDIDYGETQGTLDLREAIAEYVTHARGCRCTADQICIINGSQQAADLIARLFVDTDSTVLMEDPVYMGAQSVFQVAGAKVSSIPVDDQGIDMDYVRSNVESASLIYVTPSHQFPTGSVMSLKRRMALLKWAEQKNAFVVEDDYDSEFRYVGKPIESLQGMDTQGRVFYVGTLSKVLFPALRIGYIIVPKTLVEHVLALRWLTDRHSPAEQQHVLAQFIREGHFERHLRRMRRRYSSRRQALLNSLKGHFGDQISIQGTNAGLHLLAWFPEIDWCEFNPIAEAAMEVDVGIYSVNQFYRQAPKMLGLLMGYASLNEEQIAAGITRLAKVINSFKRKH